MTKKKKVRTLSAADCHAFDSALSSTLLSLNVSQAQHLIEKFSRLQGIASGAFIGAEILRGAETNASARIGNASPRRPLSAGQFRKLQAECALARHGEYLRSVDNMMRHTDLVRSVADGVYDDAVLRADARAVIVDYSKDIGLRHDEAGFRRGDPEIAHLDAVHRFPSFRRGCTWRVELELIGFCGGVSTYAEACERLHSLGLRFADADHLIAYAAASDEKVLDKRNVKHIAAPVSTSSLYSKTISSSAFTPNSGRQHGRWELSFKWHPDSKGVGTERFLTCPSYGEWVLAVRNQRSV